MAPLLQYQDYRCYLQNFYDWKKRTSAFSWRDFSRMAGFASPVFLKQVCEGKANLGKKAAVKVADAFGFVGAEREYFFNMVHDIIAAGSVGNFGKNLADRINTYLLENGYERNDHIGKHEKGSEKRTYRPVKSRAYGNLEIVVRGNGTTYSSYNYGNNRLTHFLIDYLGWKGRGY